LLNGYLQELIDAQLDLVDVLLPNRQLASDRLARFQHADILLIADAIGLLRCPLRCHLR
jgi:hypothetical protein